MEENEEVKKYSVMMSIAVHVYATDKAEAEEAAGTTSRNWDDWFLLDVKEVEEVEETPDKDDEDVIPV